MNVFSSIALSSSTPRAIENKFYEKKIEEEFSIFSREETENTMSYSLDKFF